MKFFTYEEIASGLPTKNDVTQAGQILEQFSRSANFMHDFVIYGSLAKGTHTWRSDIDAILIIDDSHYFYTLRDYKEKIKKIHRAVSLENVVLFKRSVVESRQHNFPEHLLSSIKRKGYHKILCGDPLSQLIPKDDISQHAYFGQYLAHKTRRCLNALAQIETLSHESVTKMMDSIFCAPNHIVRNFIFLIEGETIDPDNFVRWVLTYLKTNDSTLHIVEQMKHMKKFNHDYEEALKNNICVGGPSRYQKLCRELLHYGACSLLEITKEAQVILKRIPAA